MIEELYLENFKGIRKIKLKLRPLTIFIGPNGSGKSSALQALAVLKQSLGGSQLILEGDQVSIGAWGDVVREGDSSLEITIEHAGTLGAPSFLGSRYLAGYRFRSGDCIYVRAHADFDGHELQGEWAPPEPSEPISVPVGEGSQINFRVEGVVGGPLQYAGRSGEAVPEISERAGRLGEAFENELHSLHFVAPFRGLATTEYQLAPRTEDLSSLRSGHSPAAQLISILGYSLSLRRKVSGMLEQLFGHNVAFSLMTQNTGTARAVFERFDTPMVNDAAGANQLLFVLTQFAQAQEGSTLAVEEPEIHLHPRLQRDLVNLLVSRARDEGKRLILTTHSEHVVLAALALVLKGQVPAEDFALYQFSAPEGEVQVQETRVTKEGVLEPGLQDFFEVNIEELTDLLRALAGEGG